MTLTLKFARPLAPLLLSSLLAAWAVPAEGQVSFAKSFSPSTIGPGSVSTLIFEITSSEATPVSDLAFTDNLPAGVTISDVPNATSTCAGVAGVDAPAGGSTITFTGGGLPGTGSTVSCQVSVDVTSATPGVHMNVSGDLTSSVGNHGPATANLTVDTTLPGFTKSFSPSTLAAGGTSTLTFLIDNTASPNNVMSLSFTDDFPPGMVVANPANVSNTCDGFTIGGGPGATTITLAAGSVSAGSSCVLSVDVTVASAGSFRNTTRDLLLGDNPIGKAAAVLDAFVETLTKSFTDDPVPPGGTVTLELSITNFDRSNDLTNLTFTDDLDATLSGLVAVAPLPTDPCGSGSTLTGTSLLTLSGGNLPPEGTCTFDVTLQVPAGAASGGYPNVTSTLMGDRGGSPVSFNMATDTLVVSPEPILTKEFTDDPVIPGGTVTLELTITNTSTTSSATGISFTDDLATFLPGITPTMLPSPGFCGGGSSIIFVGGGLLIVNGGSLAPAGMTGDSCTFDVTLQVPPDYPGGTFPNTTSAITANVDGEAVTGAPASDDLVVVEAPRLVKAFTDDPVIPGNTVTLELTLTLPLEAPGGATGITFSDDLGATLMGLAAVAPLPTNPCGAGSTLTGTSTLTLSGGTLAPGDSCTFSVTLQVPMGATSGNFVNTTSPVDATVLGLATQSPPATDLLQVTQVVLTKTFLNDPVLPGAPVTLQFTIQNLSPSADATALTFTDNLAGVLSGLTATDLPKMDVCGTGATLSAAGGTFLIFTGGSLPPGGSCTFSTVLQVPAMAADGDYLNVTTGFGGTVDGTPVSFANASDRLTVDSNVLAFSKEFIDDPVAPGGTATLRFTIENLASATVTGVTFTDDLNAALSGLASTSGTLMNVCGAGSQIAGTSLLTLTGGMLAAGASCVFDVTVQVPAAAGLGTDAINVTSPATGTVSGLGVTSAPATDTLQILAVGFSKSFDGPTAVGGSPVLTFTITNLDAGAGVSLLGFVDNLDAALPGLVATSLPANPCGAGSTISGTSVLALANGSLAAAGSAGDSCSFSVPLAVPAATAPGTYSNTTSVLSAGGVQAADPATADLSVEPPPNFGKSFVPDLIGLGQTSTLTFNVVNTASAVAATSLAFTDALPAGLVVASPANESSTCGGTVTAMPGAGAITFAGGSVGAGSTCSVRVDVTATGTGQLLNTSGQLTSSSGTSGPAADMITVNPQPVVTKAFAPATILLGGVSTVTITIDNSGSTVAATDLAFTDTLPTGMSVADPPNASTTCTGATLTADAGSGTISFTGGSVAAGATCSVMVDVVVTLLGPSPNTVEVSSSLGASPAAAATLEVTATVAQIPTAGTWGLLALASLLALGGMASLRR